MRVGFAEIDITPPVGAHKVGWLKDIVSDHVLDPLRARAAVMDCGDDRIAFVQLDLLFAPAPLTRRIRRAVSAEHGFPGENVMVAATHNHAGPAVDDCGDVQCDQAYVEALVEKVVAAFGEAAAGARPAEIGFARSFDFDVPHNRRVVMRDGTVRTHGSFSDPDALCFDGPVDPEVAVLAARAAGGGPPLGMLVNFACHPTHHGPDGALTAGYPGVLAREMKSRGWAVTAFLQGASGNVHTSDPARGGADRPMDEVGRLLADDVTAALEKMEFTSDVRLGARTRTVELPFRQITDEQIAGAARGAQRFVDPHIYDRLIPAIVERIRRLGAEPAEVQVLSVNDVAFVAIPGELFVEHGLRIKQRCWPRQALVVECANGQIAYIPTKDAFQRGGYETTFGPPSWLAPEAGDLLTDAAVELIQANGYQGNTG